VIANGSDVLVLPKPSVALAWHNKEGKVLEQTQGEPCPAYTVLVDGTELFLFENEFSVIKKATRYVVGLLFDNERHYVVLIRKTHPEWQKGRLNGPGGHIEENETPVVAMRREFREEAGLDVESWEEVVTIYNHSQYWEVTFLRAFGDVTAITSMTDEEVQVHSAGALPSNIITNLTWIIPLALDETGTVRPFRVEDRGGN